MTTVNLKVIPSALLKNNKRYRILAFAFEMSLLSSLRLNFPSRFGCGPLYGGSSSFFNVFAHSRSSGVSSYMKSAKNATLLSACLHCSKPFNFSQEASKSLG